MKKKNFFCISKGTIYGHKSTIKLVKKKMIKEDIKKKLPKMSLNTLNYGYIINFFLVKL